MYVNNKQAIRTKTDSLFIKIFEVISGAGR